MRRIVGVRGEGAGFEREQLAEAFDRRRRDGRRPDHRIAAHWPDRPEAGEQPFRREEGTRHKAFGPAQVAGSASSALDTAAQDLRDNPEAPEWMASALQQAARRIESLASHVDGRNVDELGEEVAEFARRNPGTFLAASAAAGFAVSRVLRAGVDRKRHARGDGRSGGVNGNDARSAQDWPADENVRPTEAGGYAPAFGSGSTGGDFGGTTR